MNTPPTRRSAIRLPQARPEEVSREPAPFPAVTEGQSAETGFPDWRLRLMRNLARRSESRWDPLTFVHEPIIQKR